MTKNNTIKIFDTTLRDGEQSPGASMNLEDKVKIGKMLAKLNVDIIEAGFPISSPIQFKSVETVAKKVKGPRIVGLARTVPGDIKSCWDAVKHADKSGIHTFIATSDIHLKYKLKKSRDDVLKLAEKAVKYAKKLCKYVEFSAEDATRSDWTYLAKIVDVAINAGADAINIPDTVGYTVPDEYGELMRYLLQEVPSLNNVILSVHCHNDLGLATANSLTAVANGATQVECTINGIGERAGNASMEEIVMTLKTRKKFFNKDIKINTEYIYSSSKLLSVVTGIHVQPNKAIVGDNAFAHEAGIHQDGVLKSRATYEIMTPESIGVPESKIILGRHSGRHGFKKKVEALGFKLSKDKMENAYNKFVEIADKKKEVFNNDLIAIIEDETKTYPLIYSLDYFHILSGNSLIPSATIKLKKSNKFFQDTAYGDGPIDAVYKTIDRIIGLKIKLREYSIKSITAGKDALGEVTVVIEYNKKLFNGRNSSTDIIEASANAYIDAINKILYMKENA